ncbi:MAG: primosomal protein N' [Myxococcales bacterium]
MPAGSGVFTYRVPAGLIAGAVPGRRVLVPLGSRTATGVALGPAQAEAGQELREVVRLLDDGPLLTSEVLDLCRWAAAHYLYPLGLALKAALPPGIEIRQRLVATLTSAGEALLAEPAQAQGALALPSDAGAAAAGAAGRPGGVRLAGAKLSTAARTRALLRRIQGGRQLEPAQLQALARQGLVSLARQEQRARVATPLVELAAASHGAPARLAEVARAPRQREVLEYLLARQGPVPVEELLAAFPGARPLLRKLEARKLLGLREEPAGPAALDATEWGGGGAHPATRDQAAALTALTAALDAEAFAPFLLNGVTGSGKTRVYLDAIAHARARGRSALALVPEIALTPQLAGRFRARFGDDVAVLHSGLTDSERLAEWLRVRDGRAGIVVGARSAVFAPLPRLGIVVVDEEHEPSYKQEERLRYHARDLSLVRAQRAQAVCVLGSATPCLETLRRAREGRLRELTLPERVDARPLPAVAMVDRKPSLARAGRKEAPRLISVQLAEALRATLTRGEQAILFLNRRGHTRTLLCFVCGQSVGCPNCAVALVLHRAGGEKLRCHLCGHQEPPRARCAACGSDQLSPLSGGTERVEEEVREIVPDARVARLDRDSADGPGKASAILSRFARRELDVLAGTQMVAKGHDFPVVMLVGFLDADGPLQLPDFRAAERCAQLLAQVSGRAGRGDQPGRVLLQAVRPDEPAVVAARTHDYAGFAREELVRRQTLGFPPYARLAALRLQGNVEPRASAAAARLAEAARELVARGEPIDVLGPAPSPLSRLRGKHRFQVLLRAADHPPLHRVARALVALHDRHGPAGVELSVDVDPVALL